MDDQTRKLLNVLLDTLQAQSRSIATIQAKLSITTQIVMRLTAKTDLLASMAPGERETMDRVLATALSTTDLQETPAATEAYVGLVRARIEQLNDRHA